tara:strand:+ start:1254 stop:1478 length:225 start_codon:yes stop_codon:yes gene_type:complete
MIKKTKEESKVLENVLQEIIEMLFDKHFMIGDLIDEHTNNEDIKTKIIKDINNRLVLKYYEGKRLKPIKNSSDN